MTSRPGQGRGGSGAVRALARHEFRSRWRSIVLLGIACGVFFGGALATLAVIERSGSAYDRMVRTTDLADARVGTYNIYNDLSQEREVRARLSLARGSILARPDVVGSQQLTAVYARRDTSSLEYLGIWAPRHQWDGLDTPVVVSGRMPAEDRDDEVMVNEQAMKSMGLSLGDRVGVGIYRSDQVRDFDNGLGRPTAGHVELIVVGTYRVADSGTGFGGLLAGPAFAARFDATAAIGEVLSLRLDASRQSAVFGSVQDQAIALDGAMADSFGVGFYNYVDYTEPRRSPDPAIAPTEAVVRSGLGILAATVAVAGLVLALQLSRRWSARARADHAVERALGIRPREQVAARLLAVAPGVAIAVLLGVTGALLGGWFEPPGALNEYEPHPGWLAQPMTAAIGAVCVAVVVCACVALTRVAALRDGATSAPRGRAGMPSRLALGPVARFAAALGGSGGSGGRSVRSRATVAGLVISLAMVVIVVDLGSQLTRLEDSPSNWGWSADFGLSGDSLALDAQLQRDPRTRDVDQVVDAPVHLRVGDSVVRMTGYGRTSVKGALDYRVTEGRLPVSDSEVAIGARAADELGVKVGDHITLKGPSGTSFVKQVTGIAVLPTIENEPLGRNLLMNRLALHTAAISRGYSNLLIRATGPAAAEELRRELRRTVEIEDPHAPTTILALGKLAAPARLIVLVLLFGAVLLVAEYVTLLLRRRAEQFAIAASIGMTRRQLISAASASTVATALVGVVVGVVLGWAVSRVILVEIGPRLGVELARPGIVVTVLVAAGVVVVSGVIALGACWAGLRRRQLTDLRRV